MTGDLDKYIEKNKIVDKLDCISKKYSQKRVLIYGSGKLLCRLKELYSFDNINIVGISDAKYIKCPDKEVDFGYKVYTPDKIIDAKPDIILLCLQQSPYVLTKLKKYLKFNKYNAQIVTFSRPDYIDYFFSRFVQFVRKRKYEISLRPIKKNNNVYLIDDFGVKRKYKKPIKGLKIIFEGSNNTIILHEKSLNKFKKTTILCKENCCFEITKPIKYIFNSEFYLSARNVHFQSGGNIHCVGAKVYLSYEPDLLLKIGDDCMFAEKLLIRTSDAHTIYDKDTKMILNKGKSIVIGNKVWLCYHTTVLKGSVIPDNTIVASGSLICKKYTENNTILGGVPAKVIKRNVDFDARSPIFFDDTFVD